MYLSKDNQFQAFILYIQNRKLDVPLRELNWADFARQYNGPKYKENRYDERLREAYERFCDKSK